VLCNALNISQIRLWVAPQDSENCGRNFAKRKQSDAEFAGTSLGNDAWLLLNIDTVIHILLGGLTLDPAGMHCPSWDDAFVSIFFNSAVITALRCRVWPTNH